MINKMIMFSKDYCFAISFLNLFSKIKLESIWFYFITENKLFPNVIDVNGE